jgi:hypothetical protein
VSGTDAHLPYRLVPPEDMPRRSEVCLTWRWLVRWPRRFGRQEMTAPARHNDRLALAEVVGMVSADPLLAMCTCCARHACGAGLTSHHRHRALRGRAT